MAACSFLLRGSEGEALIIPGLASEKFPVEIFLGHIILLSSHSVPLQQAQKFGTLCLPKHTVTCCKCVLFVLCNLARSCYSSL